jgi:hypothetical protein
VDTSLKENLSIDTTFDPLLLLVIHSLEGMTRDYNETVQKKLPIKSVAI